MLHQIRSDARPRSAQSRLTMHRKGLIGRDPFEGAKHSLQNLHRRAGPVQVELIEMLDSRLNKVLLLVVLLVESDDERHVLLFEVGDVIGRSEGTISFGRDRLLKGGPRKCQNAALNDPIQITVLRV